MTPNMPDLIPLADNDSQTHRWSVTASGEKMWSSQTIEVVGTMSDVEKAVARFMTMGLYVPVNDTSFEYQRAGSVQVKRID